MMNFAKNGIRINPKNKGKFTETKKRTGKTTEELTHSKNPLTRKRAIFALNAKKWKHQLGGSLGYEDWDLKTWDDYGQEMLNNSKIISKSKSKMRPNSKSEEEHFSELSLQTSPKGYKTYSFSKLNPKGEESGTIFYNPKTNDYIYSTMLGDQYEENRVGTLPLYLQDVVNKWKESFLIGGKFQGLATDNGIMVSKDKLVSKSKPKVKLVKKNKNN